jgi:glycosyltransferase involved in cell wall biosynthesis
MPSFNQAAYLEEAICSVLSQDYLELEFMVLDGGSTDGSQKIIERYSDHLSYWRSQPDGGQSTAIDLGMGRATGELVGWLNSDDVLLPGALLAVAEAYRRNPESGLLGGNLVFMDRNSIITGFLRMPRQAAWFARRGVFTVSGPGSFFRLQDYRAVGGIRKDLHYVMDNELYIRMMLRGVKFMYIDRYLAVFRRHADQKTSSLRDNVDNEVRKLDAELNELGMRYRPPLSLLIYYLWQTLNGNYLKKRVHKRAARGQHWRTWAHTLAMPSKEVL